MKTSKDTKTIKGNGHINTSNVNALNSECITLTYTVWQFKNPKQVTAIQKGISDIVSADDVTFALEISDYQGLEEKYKLKASIKSCNKEKQAHDIKEKIDKYIKAKGGQTTLDESAVEEDE